MGTKSTSGTKELQKWRVVLCGAREIMFDRYIGQKALELPTKDKMYVDKGGVVCLPASNIYSFMGAENTTSAAKKILGKSFRDAAQATLSFVDISPFPLIPFVDDKGKPIVFDGFGENKKFYEHRAVARLPKGIPNDKVRPVMRLPWALHLEVVLRPNDYLDGALLHRLFVDGGGIIGLGTYRGLFGKFTVPTWEDLTQ